jgi:hypothetical protein
MKDKAHPFIDLGLNAWVGRGSSIVHDEGELGVKLVNYLVGLLGHVEVGHGDFVGYKERKLGLRSH